MKTGIFIKKAGTILRSGGVSEPELSARHIAAAVLKIKFSELFFSLERKMTAAEIKAGNRMLALRAGNRPLSWIFGNHDFNGLKIFIFPGVFVPRPETEELAALILSETLKKSGKPKLMDFCAGSGCIGLYLASGNPNLSVYSLEKSEKGFACVKANTLALKLKNLLAAKSSNPDFFGEKFDFFAANPPYIPSGIIKNLDPEVRMEPRAALDGGKDGLDLVREIEKKAPLTLKKKAVLFLEFGDGQGPAVKKIFSEGKWKNRRLIKDINSKERFFRVVYNG